MISVIFFVATVWTAGHSVFQYG